MANVYNLSQNVTIQGGKFKTDEEDGIAIGTATLKKGQDAAVIEDKHGILYADDKKDGVYTFQALTGGEFQFTDNAANAAITSFDGSAASSAIKMTVDGSNLASLTKVYTGSGKDDLLVRNIKNVEFDLGAGNDHIAIEGGSGTLTLGAGRDTVSLVDINQTEIKITDYSYGEGDLIYMFQPKTFDMKYDKSSAVITGGKNTSVTVGTNMNNGVYEFQLMDQSSKDIIHYVRTNTASVDYVAKDAIDFESDKNTTTLNLTLAGKSGESNNINIKTGDGTVNLVTGKANNHITVEAGVELGLGITKKSGETDMVDSNTNTRKLEQHDTLYLLDGGKISQVEFDGSGNLQYGNAKILNGYDNTAEGTFRYNINGETGVLAYGNGAHSAVTYAKDITYYANAEAVNAEGYGEVILNLNGDKEVQFADSITDIAGISSGLVAGRNKQDNKIFLATEANKKTEVYGGVAGNDTIDFTDADEESTNVIWYSNGDGKDTVNGFKKGNNSIYFHDSAAAASILNDVTKVVGSDLTVSMDKSNVLTLKDVVDTKETKVINFNDVAGNKFKVAVGNGTDVKYTSGVNIYKNAKTLKVEGEDEMVIYTGAKNDQYGYYDKTITTIDATGATGTVYLSGTNTNGMEIKGGDGVNHMWGGGDKVQTLTGGYGVNVFWFGNGDGRDTAKNAKAEDGVNLYNVEKIDDVTVKTSTNYFTVNVGSNSLKVDLGTAKADEVLKTFTFADKAGVQYTYDTKTNKFQQK